MRRILLSTVAVVLCAALVATAQAGPKPKHGGGQAPGKVGPGKTHQGKTMPGKAGPGRTHPGRTMPGKGPQGKHGIYRGRDHSHWSRVVWDGRYGCRLYLDPATGTWYYWCPPDDCYYPIDECPYDKYDWDE